jgi:hypothetical protein
VLVAGRGLHGRDDLARDAQLREVAERGFAVRPEVADRLVQADQALLDQVLGVTSDEEVRRRLQPHERRITPDEPVVRVWRALARQSEKILVIKLYLSLRLGGSNSSHERRGPFQAMTGLNACDAHLPRRQE